MQSRRSFLWTTSAIAVGAIGGCTGEADPGGDAGGTTDDTAGDTAGDTSDDTSSTGSGSGTDDGSGVACEPSPSDIEGPFYRPGIPVGGNLDVHGDGGVVLLLSGLVSDTNCEPIHNAVVELWHATPVAPSGEPGDMEASYDDTQAYRYYGQVATDADGGFSFRTLKPGWYLNGSDYRPAHLHIKIWVGTEERLTTQLYFEGDPFNDADAWFNPAMALAPDASGSATIDFVV